MKDCPNCNEEVPSKFDICWNCNYDYLEKKVISKTVENESKSPYIIKPKNLNCLRCKTKMTYVKKINVSDSSWGVLGDFGHIFDNRDSFDMYLCESCDKIELFSPVVSKSK